MLKVAALFCLVGLSAALPTEVKTARYEPSVNNVFHLFTRENPQVSQPFFLGSDSLVANSNYYNLRRTVFLIHGWKDAVISDMTVTVIPALLAAEDLNVIVVDWSAGASTDSYDEAVANTVSSGVIVGATINWLNTITGTNPGQYHIIGHGLGGHQAGIAARLVDGDIPLITALDPSLNGWTDNENRLRIGDALSVEVIHTNAGGLGYDENIGNVDFYPNGGRTMPGCGDDECNHARSYFYFAESLISGGFEARLCTSLSSAHNQLCFISLPFPVGPVLMGGRKPKFSLDGIYGLSTNASPPFSQD